MTQRVSDSEMERAMKIARFAKHQHAVMERVLKGSLDPEEVIRAVQALIDRGGKCITVDYGMSLADKITAGRYDWANDRIVSTYFPILGSGKVELSVELAHFDRNISTDDAAKELHRRGLRPATLAELLAYGALFPEDQRKFPIVALGTEALFGGDRRVACLYGDGSERCLDLRWVGDAWDGHFRFLAVRN